MMFFHNIKLASLMIFLAVLFVQIWGHCPKICDCRSAPTSCSIGVSFITDGCGCCKICAKQLNQPCNNETDLCDPHKQLFCNFSTASSAEYGVCEAEKGRPCVYNGISMISGTSFQPSCKEKCQCLDGSWACVMQCPHESERPKLCPDARLQSIDGQCCDAWVCNNTRVPQESFSGPVWDDTAEDTYQTSLLESEIKSLFTNEADAGIVYDWNGGSDGDELSEQETDILYHTNSKETNQLPGENDYITSEEEGVGASSCTIKQSRWSECSKTCDLGISSRVTNINPECIIKRETRLCFIKPCSTDEKETNEVESRKCSRPKVPRKRILFSYAGCQMNESFRPRFCKRCKNKCCIPRNTETISLRFRCSDGRTFHKKFMSIRSCRCKRQNCSETRPSNLDSSSERVSRRTRQA